MSRDQGADGGQRGKRRWVTTAAVLTIGIGLGVGLTDGPIAGFLVVFLISLIGGLVYVGYWFFGGDDETEEPPRDRSPGATDWQDVVIDEVDKRRGRTYLRLRNTSDQTWDLSGAVIRDDNDKEFTFREGVELEPGDTEALPVDASMEITRGNRVPLRTRTGTEYELQWASVVDERRPNR